MIRVDHLIVDLRDDVVDLDASLPGRRTRNHLADDDPDGPGRQSELRGLPLVLALRFTG